MFLGYYAITLIEYVILIYHLDIISSSRRSDTISSSITRARSRDSRNNFLLYFEGRSRRITLDFCSMDQHHYVCHMIMIS